MKKLFLACFLIAATFSFQSCKDDDKKSTGNELSYDGGKIKVIAALRDMDPDSEEGSGGVDIYFHEVLLISEGFTYDVENLYGAGDAVAITLVTGSETEIPEGTYTIALTSVPFTLDATMYIDYDADNETAGAVHYPENGTVVVAKAGDTYTLTLDLMFDGKKLTGTYKGTLSEFTP
jgi:hypothetical protein